MDSMQRGAPGSVYAITALAEGQPGAGWRVAWLTLQRAAVIGAGLYLAGIRGRELARGSVAGAAAVTAWIYMVTPRG